MIKLEEKYRGSYVDGIFFTEDTIAEAHTVLGKVKYDTNHMNAHLGIIKAKLASKVKWQGANVIMNFKYGQKRAFFWDHTKWYGEGIAVKLGAGLSKNDI